MTRRTSYSDDAFADAIYSLSNNLKESQEVPVQIIDIFFKLAEETDSLPKNCDKETIDAFLTSIVALMNQNIGSPTAVKGLEVLFKFLKNGKSL